MRFVVTCCSFVGHLRYTGANFTYFSVRWNIGGVEAVIHDDGMEWDAAEDQISKDDVTLGEILSAMDEKYDVLRNKLIWEMVRQQIGKKFENSPQLTTRKLLRGLLVGSSFACSYDDLLKVLV